MNGNTRTQNIFRYIYLIGFFLILSLPLLNIQPWFSPPAWGKTIVFRIFLSILIFFFIWQILFKKQAGNFSAIVRKILDRKSKVFWPFWLLIAVLGIFSLATIFSLNPHFSFWGSPYRSGGFLNFAFYIIFAVLAFFILRKKDWQKILDFVFIVGILVALIAIIQQFGLFSKTFIPYEWRPSATLGSSILLSLYLLLLTFLSLSFAIKEKGKKRFFYFFSFFLFIFGLILAAGRASFLGLSIGGMFFVFFYPAKKSLRPDFSKKIVWLKILFGASLILAFLGIYWLNTQPRLAQVLEENKVLAPAFYRIRGLPETFFNVQNLFATSNRVSGWKVAFEALKERPILGYGPENFSIAFDKYYDPLLPGFDGSDWWDKAHNFVFDISVTAGIPALIIYLSLFGALFWQLQKLKFSAVQRSSAIETPNNAELYAEQRRIIAHGLQATFIAYLVANFFSFDCFSTYLISFLFIGYSLHLISLGDAENTPNHAEHYAEQRRRFSDKIIKWKKPILAFLLIILIWFIWAYNLKPLQINKEANWAVHYARKENYEKALQKMEKVLSSHSIIDNYLRLQYIELINRRIKNEREKTLELTKKGIQILKESIKLRPYYTRSWWFLGIYTNYLIRNAPDLKIEVREDLKKEAITYSEKALQLNPNRWEISKDLAEAYLLNNDYEKAKEKAQKCVELEPKARECWWQKGISNIALGQIEEGQEDIKVVKEKGYDIESKKALLQLVKAYDISLSKITESSEETEAYQALADIYQKLIEIEYKNFQYHASLAYVYKMLEDYPEARKEAMIVLELSPESRPTVEEFLKTLPY